MTFQSLISLKVLAFLALAASGHASTTVPRANAGNAHFSANVEVQVRALPNAPSGYTPTGGDCPSDRPRIRSASQLSSNETSWLEVRRNKTIDPMRELLGRLNITGFDAAGYISNHAQNSSALPNVGIAMSGGGYRALMNGGGALQAFDIREENSTSSGHLGGLLQSATYLAGLSGGGWLVGSIFLNNFTSISALINEKESSVWDFSNSILKGPATGGIQILDTAQYFNEISNDVNDKADNGFNTSITDYWGRALSYQFINATDGGPAYTWSSIALEDQFMNGDTPLPLLVADSRAPDVQLVGGNATVYEFNPWEFGTFDPTTYGFAPLEYLGSEFSSGVLPSDKQCVRGFDNAGYVMGTSSSLFNALTVQVDGLDIPDAAKTFVTKILADLGDDDNDIADYSPNPFFGFRNSSNEFSQTKRLTLVDGGEDLQNIPLHPLIQPDRHVDVIFAVDSSADTSNWPNGTALVATYERSLTDLSNGTSFPAVPGQNTFVNLGLNSRPTFFGCNSSNTTSPTPLVVYIPNFPYVAFSNVSTSTLSYNDSMREAVVRNGYESATMGNATADAQWPTCVGCAILSRSLERTGTTVPDVCQQCFRNYCWDGTVNNTAPAAYEPTLRGNAIKVTSAAIGRGRIDGASLAAVVVMTAIIAAIF
ncbi:Lysophospholipase 1 [Pseudocyphellaria aurata]|nr:Lysophospholipase 1 [Pseudocyphellaria aurata]